MINKEDKISILLCGDILYDSRVKRFSKFLDNNYSNVVVRSLNRKDEKNENYSNTYDFNHKEYTLISDYILPKGGKWGYIKYMEFFIKFFAASISSKVIYCNDIETLPVGYLIKLIFKNKKIIYDTHELAPYKGSPSRKKIRIRALVESFLIKKADSVLTVSQRIAVWYKRVYKLQEVVPLYNSPEVNLNQSDEVKFLKRNQNTKFVWHGILSKNRGIEKVLDVFSNSLIENISVTFIGWGELEGKIRSKSLENKNIILKEPMMQQELLAELKNYDCGLFTYENSSKNYDWAVPNKFFEYANAFLPLITFPLTESKKIVNDYGFGVICSDFSSTSLEVAMHKFINLEDNKIIKLKNNSNSFLQENSWEKQKSKLTKIFNNL